MFLLKKKLLGILLLVMVAVFSFSAFASAQEVTSTTTNNEAGEGGIVQFDTAGNIVYGGLTAIGRLIAWIGGSLLDVSLSLFVVNMVGTMEALGLDNVIDYVWSLIRDLFNIAFIFGLILIGFRIIWGIDDSGAKRNLGSLIVAALLINFSLFVTQLVVDFGNIAAVEISTQFVTPSSSNWNILGLPIRDISSSFIEAASLDKVSNNTLTMATELATGRIELPQRSLNILDAIGLGLVVCLMFAIIGITFAAGAFLMITRFFTLFVLMIFSPIMFLGMVLPNFKKRSSDWWSSLFKQTIVGPAFLFMLWVALYAMKAMTVALGEQQLNTITFIISSILVAGFVWMALKVAQNLGGAGGKWAVSTAGNAAFSFGGGIMRGTVGRRFQSISENQNLRDAAANRKGLTGWAARQAFKTSSVLGDASFDGRQTPGLSGVTKNLGLSAGRKGGYATRSKEIEDREKAIANSFGKVSDDDPVLKQLNTEIEEGDYMIKAKKEAVQENRKKLGDPKTSETERQAIRATIEATKAELEDLEEKKIKNTERREAEYSRRQLGDQSKISAATNIEIEKNKTNLKEHINEFVSLQNELNDPATTPERKEKIKSEDLPRVREHIAEAKETKATLEKKTNKEAGGYATVVEAPGSIKPSAWARGIKNLVTDRNNAQNQEAANAIRKEHKSKAKGKKD